MNILNVTEELVVGSAPGVQVTNGGEAATLNPGWHPMFVYTGLSPILILCLRHDDGSIAPWFLDAEMRRIGGTIRELTDPLRVTLAARCCPLFGAIWVSFILRPGTLPVDSDLLDFFSLPLQTRLELLDFYLASDPALTRYQAADLAGGPLPGASIIQADAGRVVMRAEHIAAMLNPHRVQEQNVQILSTGKFVFPSPVDGREVPATGALFIGLNCYAYCFVDLCNNLTFYVLTGEIYFRPTCIFIPAAGLVVAGAPDVASTQYPDLTRQFYAHVVLHGYDMHLGWAGRARTVANIWYGMTALHLGHVLWNDISGIEQLIDGAPQARLPLFVLYDTAVHPEMYGPIDTLFPEINGRVERNEGSFMAGIPALYRRRIFPIRQAGMKVTRNVRDRVMKAIDQAPNWSLELERSRMVASRGPLIMLGLRTENRTIPDLKGFCVALVGHLARTIGTASIVVDGHNSRGDVPDQLIWSHGEVDRSTKSPILIERDILEAMRAASRDTNVAVYDTIGSPVAHSLIWCRASRFFVTMWGAGLAKYRWVCNKRGFVMTNRYNLESRPHISTMNIYHEPVYMDDPTPMNFIDASAVRDLPDAQVVVDLGGNDPTVMNFELDWAAAFLGVDVLLQQTAT